MSGAVVIAGAGPTGLMLACELRLAGIPVVVADPVTERPERSGGMAVHGRTLEVFRQRGLADRIVEDDMFFWPRTPFAFLWLDLDTVDERDHTFAYPQWRTERLLEQRALELGADVRRGRKVTGFEQDADGVRVVLSGPGGDDRLDAAYLVGCDGAGSTVRDLAGIAFPDEGPTHYALLGDVALPEGAEHEFDRTIGPEGIYGALPIAPGELRLMTMEFGIDPPGDDTPVTSEELLAAVKRVTGRDAPAGEVLWLSRFGGTTRLADRYRDGRVFLAGDAAHVLFISGTQGLNTGVHDAVNLGWKLAADLNGWAPPGLLDSYEDERRPVGVRVHGHAQAAMALLTPFDRVGPLRSLFGELLEFAEVNRHLLRMTTDVRYPMGGPGGPEHPLLGRPLPDVPLSAADGGPRSTATALRTGRGVLFDLSGGTADVSAAAPWSDRVDLVAASPDGDLGAAVLLARPDGHVAYCASESASPEGLRDALARWFGTPAARIGG